MQHSCMYSFEVSLMSQRRVLNQDQLRSNCQIKPLWIDFNFTFFIIRIITLITWTYLLNLFSLQIISLIPECQPNKIEFNEFTDFVDFWLSKMSRYMTNNTGNCTEIWAGTAFYQDCFEQTVSMQKVRLSQFDRWWIFFINKTSGMISPYSLSE